jgi:serine/threonine protein kinase
VVWHGLDERLGRPVAVKTIAYGVTPAMCERIQREAQAAARIIHPHIATTYDWGVYQEHPFVVMELAEGTSLAHILQERGVISWQAAVTCSAQIADALASMHARGLVHRDVTPANIILSPDGAKLIDFGISAVQGESELDDDGNLRGTPAYAAPERLAEGAVEPAGDVYSLGVLLYRMLSGRLPWLAKSAAELLRLQHTSPPDPLPVIDGMPAEIGWLCMSCLSASPVLRPSIAQIAADLAAPAAEHADALTLLAFGAEHDATLTRMLPRAAATPAPAKRRNVVRSTGLAVVVPIAAALAWWVTGGTPTDRQPAPPAVAIPAPQPVAVPQCAVTYQIAATTPRTFAATITVRNTGPQTLSSWQLAFDLPGDQGVDTRGGDWSQSGPHVVTADTQPLRPGTAVMWRITGRHPGTNQLPTTFSLNGQNCDVALLGPSGASITPSSIPRRASPRRVVDPPP